MRFESVWVEDPPILFELPVPGEEIVWRGMYALIDEYIECLLELWYYRRLGERIDLQAFQPVVGLWFHGTRLGEFRYNIKRLSFQWERTCIIKTQKGAGPVNYYYEDQGTID